MSQQIQAKVAVTDIVESKWGNGEKCAEEITATPVFGNGEENKSYSDATPSGLIKLTITNKNAWGFFVLGKEYYVLFNPAP